MKLNPEITVRDWTAGSAAIKLSTLVSTSWARSCEVPGGKVTEPIIVPVSSFGTIPVGVMLMNTTKSAIAPATRPIDSQRLWINATTRFLYFASNELYDLLNESLNLSVVIPAKARTLITIITMQSTGCSLKLKSPKIIPKIAIIVKRMTIFGFIHRPRASAYRATRILRDSL